MTWQLRTWSLATVMLLCPIAGPTPGETVRCWDSAWGSQRKSLVVHLGVVRPSQWAFCHCFRCGRVHSTRSLHIFCIFEFATTGHLRTYHVGSNEIQAVFFIVTSCPTLTFRKEELMCLSCPNTHKNSQSKFQILKCHGCILNTGN